MNYEEKLLVYLVDGYRKSKKDTGENLTHRRTKVKPEKLYSKYHANDGDFERISAINHVVEKLEKKKKRVMLKQKEKISGQNLKVYIW